MPKLKTKKSLTKRMRVTKNGKVLRSKSGRRHLLSHKSGHSKRSMRKKAVVPGPETIMMRRALPYAF